MRAPTAQIVVRDPETGSEWAATTCSAWDPRLLDKIVQQQADTSVEFLGVRLMGLPDLFTAEQVAAMDRTPR